MYGYNAKTFYMASREGSLNVHKQVFHFKEPLARLLQRDRGAPQHFHKATCLSLYHMVPAQPPHQPGSFGRQKDVWEQEGCGDSRDQRGPFRTVQFGSSHGAGGPRSLGLLLGAGSPATLTFSLRANQAVSRNDYNWPFQSATLA